MEEKEKEGMEIEERINKEKQGKEGGEEGANGEEGE